MKITITGSLGNISKPLAEKLIAAGHKVTIISSSADKAAAIEALGATPAIGSVEDVDFLTKAFTGADAVYTMVPPNFVTNAWKKYIAGIGHNYAIAIKNAGIKRVVNLSSIGGHLPKGAGPISGMHFVEEEFNGLDGVAVKHLRPGFFYTNFYHNVDMIKGMGIIGANYKSDSILSMVSPNDIAGAAADVIQSEFSGKSHVYIISSVYTSTEVAAILGAAVGNPNLPWVEFKDGDVVAAMEQNHASHDVAVNYAEMGAIVKSGKINEDLNKSPNVIKGKTSFDAFAKEFAKAF
jgi:uncharacterized protein YbjT (DUF2867 family)